MINEKLIRRRFRSFSNEDIQVILDFLYFSNSKETFSENSLQRQCYTISKLLQNKALRNFDWEIQFCNNYILYSESKTYLYRKFAYKFIVYLCEHNLIPFSPLYRIIQIKELIYPASLNSFYSIKIFLFLENDKFLKFTSLQKNHSNKWLRTFLLLNLQESDFHDEKLFRSINSEFTNFKFYENCKSTSPSLFNIERFREISNDIIQNYDNDITIDEFIYLFRKWEKSRNLFIRIIKILNTNNFFVNKIVVQYMNLIDKLKGSSCKYISVMLEKLYNKKNPNLWFLDRNNVPIYCNCANLNIRLAIKGFYDNTISKIGKLDFLLNEFDTSIGSPVTELSFYTYLKQIEYFRTEINKMDTRKRNTYLSYYKFTCIHSFYTYYQVNFDSEVFEKNGYSTSLLGYCGLAHLISKGYKVINYNNIDSVPQEDRWILCYKTSKYSHLIGIKSFDFLRCSNPHFRKWFKAYIWYKKLKMKTKLQQNSFLFIAFDYIDSLKKGKTKSYFVTEKNDNDDINLQEVRAYKHYILSTYDNTQTQISHLFTFRSLLKFISDNNIHRFDLGIFVELKSLSNNAGNDNSKPIDKDTLVKIADKIQSLGKQDVRYQLYYLVFYLLIETEFRFTQIANLKIDCVRETSKKGEYVIYSETKTSNQDYVEQPITIYTKRCIDEILNITAKYRKQNSDLDLNTLLFLFPSQAKKLVFDGLREQSFNAFLKGICNSLKLGTVYTIANLRDSHMTFSENYIIKQHLSDVQLNILTSHSSSVTTRRHYSRPDIIEMLEVTNGIIIGDIDLQGNIVKKIPSNIEKVENLVADECGFCSSDKCSIFSELGCLLCKDFVTTISRKPYFEEQIKLIDTIMKEKTFPHDKKDLINRKRLLLGYLESIIELEEENFKNE